MQQTGTLQAASTLWISWVILWHDLFSGGVIQPVCVCVCVWESLLPAVIVWIRAFCVAKRQRAFTHSATRACMQAKSLREVSKMAIVTATHDAQHGSPERSACTCVLERV